MRNEVQLIATVGSTSFVNSGPFTIATPSGGTTEFLVNLNGPTAAQITIGSVITGPNGGNVTSSIVTAFDSGTGLITFDAWLDYSNISPSPAQIDIYLATLSDTTESIYVDLYEYESISQNWRFTDIQDLTSVGSFSRQFRIPNSVNNAKLFGALSDVNYSPDFNFFQRKLKAEIRLNWLPIAKGHLQLIKAYKQLDKITDYELVFFGETPDLVRSVNDKKLKDISDLVNLNTILDYSEVTANTSPKLYALADRGQKWSEGGEPLTRTVVSDSAQVFAADLTPHLNAW